MTNQYDTMTRQQLLEHLVAIKQALSKHPKPTRYTGTYCCQNLQCNKEHETPSAQCECGHTAYSF